jgi:hypothetical protein
MNEVLMLADLDNVHWFDLGQASLAARIKVVVGQMQSKLSTALVQQAQALPHRMSLGRGDLQVPAG